MIGLLFLIPCALVIAAFQSTAEGRADARVRFARHNGIFTAIIAMGVAFLLWR